MDNAALRYDAEKKSLVVAVLLWLFLGVVGAHYFYLGRFGAAIATIILFIASFIIPGVIFFFGLFMLLSLIGLIIDVKDTNAELAKSIQSESEATKKKQALSEARDNPLKSCPDCAEEVKAAAKKCRFCGYQFTEETPKPVAKKPANKPRPMMDGNRLDKIERTYGNQTQKWPD
jgi:TM2 domain-containing membrane protein YozV